MRSIAALCAGVVAALLLSQASGAPRRRTRRGADAGTRPTLLGTDPPGRLRVAPPSDAGVAQQDAGPDEVHQKLQALQARIDALERDRELQQQQAQLLQQLVVEMRELRGQMADADARQKGAEQDRAARRSQLQYAVSGLQSAQARLMSGDADVDAVLEQAGAAFTGQARYDVEAARRALQNRDLSQARAYLNAAITDAAQER
jgi:TolA-binding protein